MVYLHPENDPGGTAGNSLHRMADSLNLAVGPLVAASDVVALAAAERGESPEANPGVTELVQGLEATINYVGAGFVIARGLMDKVTEMTAEEFTAAKGELAELAPNFDWQGYYERNHKRDPGRVGKIFRPILRVLGVEPPYWR